jgi:hypothetical protein
MIHDGEESLVLEKSLGKNEAFPNIDTLFLSNTPGLSDFFGTTQYVDSYPKCRSNLSH